MLIGVHYVDSDVGLQDDRARRTHREEGTTTDTLRHTK